MPLPVHLCSYLPRTCVALFACTLAGASFAQGPAQVNLDIQLDKPLHKVSKTLYGLMTEEINYSYDGGLYAELVRNRTFGGRSHGQPAHWYLVEDGTGRGSKVDPGGMQWESDLIGYDAMTSYGSPSYYAQVLFSRYLGDSVPASTLTGAGEHFFYSATTDTAAGKLYLKLVNGSSDPVNVAIHLDGMPHIAHEGMLQTLSGTNPAETNTIADPKRIIPIESSLKGAGASFDHKMPPLSIQVIELSTR